MSTPFSNICGRDRDMMASIVHDAVQVSIINCYDLHRIAEEFSSGDMADAFKLCLEKGIQEYLLMLDIPEE